MRAWGLQLGDELLEIELLDDREKDPRLPVFFFILAVIIVVVRAVWAAWAVRAAGVGHGLEPLRWGR